MHILPRHPVQDKPAAHSPQPPSRQGRRCGPSRTTTAPPAPPTVRPTKPEQRQQQQPPTPTTTHAVCARTLPASQVRCHATTFEVGTHIRRGRSMHRSPSKRCPAGRTQHTPPAAAAIQGPHTTPAVCQRGQPCELGWEPTQPAAGRSPQEGWGHTTLCQRNSRRLLLPAAPYCCPAVAVCVGITCPVPALVGYTPCDHAHCTCRHGTSAGVTAARRRPPPPPDPPPPPPPPRCCWAMRWRSGCPRCTR